MKRSRFTESQIVEILKEADVGLPANEVWRKHGISSATYYIYGRLPRGKKVSGSVLNENRLQTSIRRHHLKARPNGKSAHTLLDKWSA
jgi:hypothetical protein